MALLCSRASWIPRQDHGRLTAYEFSGDTLLSGRTKAKMVDARRESASRAHQGVVRCNEGLGDTASEKLDSERVEIGSDGSATHCP